MYKTTLKNVETSIKQCEDTLRALKESRDQLLSNKMYTCPHCNKKSQIKKLFYFEDYFYVPPYGCTGGDYHKSSGDDFVLCNKCNKVGRLYFSKNEKLKKFKYSFEDVLKTYNHKFDEALEKYKNER